MPYKTILFLDQYPGLSGGQRVLLNISLEFSRNGYRCIVALPSKGPLSAELEKNGIETVVLPIGYYSITRKNIFDFFSYILRLPILIFLLLRLIKNKEINIVYANGARTFIWATVACRLKKLPLFWHVHSIFKNPTLIWSLLFFAKSNVVKKIFVVSKSAAWPLKNLKSKLEIMYNAISIPKSQEENNILKKEHPALDNYFLVGSIGILEDWKNQKDLIMAAKYIEDSGFKNMAFFIIGDSLSVESSKQKYKNKLKKLTHIIGMENKIIFTGLRNDILRVLPSLNILVISSKTPDPCPLVSLEAASLGVPIISTHFGGTKEMFIEDIEALFYKPEDYKVLAEEIIYLAKNPSKLNSIAEAARLKVINNHNIDIYLKKLTDIVEKETRGS